MAGIFHRVRVFGFLGAGHLDDGPKMVTKKMKTERMTRTIRCLANILTDQSFGTLRGKAAESQLQKETHKEVFSYAKI
jgi:hypothetical protein